MNKQVFAIALTLISMPALADVQVVDGDTLKIDGQSYRIEGIDAPEAGQRCNDGSGTWPCGNAATQAMADLVIGADVRCEALFDDDFDRTVAHCWANERNVGAHMVRSGMAWAFVEYSDTYVEDERLARSERIGIWQAPTQTPWDFRAERWEVAEQEAPDGCPIKGNISQHGKIYHTPWSPWYSRTKISLERGERWFCNEAEAIAAGWRAPLWH